MIFNCICHVFVLVLCICICLNQPNPRAVPLQNQPTGRSHSLYIKPLDILSLMRITQVQIVIQIAQCICPNQKMYLFQLTNVFAKIYQLFVQM